MDWNEFLLWLHLTTTQYCKKELPQKQTDCYTVIHECVLDGEKFEWCQRDWEGK
jgi:uncharacterized protein YgiB involved in biofilm formation